MKWHNISDLLKHWGNTVIYDKKCIFDFCLHFLTGLQIPLESLKWKISFCTLMVDWRGSWIACWLKLVARETSPGLEGYSFVPTSGPDPHPDCGGGEGRGADGDVELILNGQWLHLSYAYVMKPLCESQKYGVPLFQVAEYMKVLGRGDDWRSPGSSTLLLPSSFALCALPWGCSWVLAVVTNR